MKASISRRLYFMPSDWLFVIVFWLRSPAIILALKQGGLLGSLVLRPEPVFAATDNLVWWPYLQQMTDTSVIILWTTRTGTTPVVRYAADTGYGQQARGTTRLTPLNTYMHRVELTGLNLAGPAQGVLDTGQTFLASASPITVTLPLTYLWQAEAQPLTRRTSGLGSTVTFTWTLPGTYQVKVTATDSQSNTVSGSHTILITHTVSP